MDSFASDITPSTRNSDNAETRCVNKVVQVMFILYCICINTYVHTYVSVCLRFWRKPSTVLRTGPWP
jgi:hypothetical protein